MKIAPDLYVEGNFTSKFFVQLSTRVITHAWEITFRHQPRSARIFFPNVKIPAAAAPSAYAAVIAISAAKLPPKLSAAAARAARVVW